MNGREVLHLGDEQGGRVVQVWWSWTTLLFGYWFDSHPTERTFSLNLGPLALSVWWYRR